MQGIQKEDDSLYCQDSQLFQDFAIPSSKQYQVFQFNDIFQLLADEIKSIQEIALFDFDNSLELFIHYNWNIENMNNNYFSGDQDEIIKNLKASGEFNDHQMSTLAQKTCPVCLYDGELVNFGCHHAFCRNCLRGSIRQRVEKEGYHYVICLQDGCSYRLPYSFIITCTQEYNKSLCKQYIRKSKSLACCTGYNCNRILKPLDTLIKEIQCECGNLFCFRCKEDVHTPAPCDLVQKWFKDVYKEKDNEMKYNNEIWIAANTKICPFCKNAVQKSGGCNYMRCKPPGGCGESFCYACGNPWTPDHYSSSKCLQQKQNDPTFQKDIAGSAAYYKKKFLSSEMSREKGLKCYANIKKIQEYFVFNKQDFNLVKEALRELIQSRLSVKWSYCLGYFINFSDKSTSEILTYNLNSFHSTCDSLEIDLFQLLGIVQREFIQQSGAERYKLKLTKLKDKVLAAQEKCSKYRRNLNYQFIQQKSLFQEQTN